MDRRISELPAADGLAELDLFAKASVGGVIPETEKVTWAFIKEEIVAAAVAAALAATQAIIDEYLER